MRGFSRIGIALVLILNAAAEDKVFLKGSSVPTTGVILGMEKNQIYVQIGEAGTTGLALANVDRVEMAIPDSVTKGIQDAEAGKDAAAIATLDPTVTNFLGLPVSWMEDALLQLAQSYLAIQDWSNALERFSQLRTIYPQSPKLDMALAGESLALYQLKQFDAARKELETLFQSHSTEMALTADQNKALSRASVLLGKCYLVAKQDDKALEAFLSATTLYYLDSDAVAEAQFQSALLFEKINKLPRARGQLEDLIQEHPLSPLVADAKKKLESLPKIEKSPL